MGLGGRNGTIRDQSKAAVASATTQFRWQDPSLSTVRSRCEKNLLASLCYGKQVRAPAGPVNPTLANCLILHLEQRKIEVSAKNDNYVNI